MDDVPTAQPALALAHKVVQRARRAGLPADLIPTQITSITVTADVDAENVLRTAVLEFMDTVRGTEKAIASERRGEDVPAELDVAQLGTVSEEEWRAYWPPPVANEPEGSADEVGPEDAGDEPAAESEALGGQGVTTDAVAPTQESAQETEEPADEPSDEGEPE